MDLAAKEGINAVEYLGTLAKPASRVLVVLGATTSAINIGTATVKFAQNPSYGSGNKVAVQAFSAARRIFLEFLFKILEIPKVL